MRKWISYICCPLLGLASSVFGAEEVQPVVILGGGIGGLTAAIYTGRAGISPLLIEGPTPGGAITQSHTVQNWPGELEISGLDLMEKVHKQAESCGAQFLKEEVVSVDFTHRPFIITTQDPINPSRGHKIKAQTCIIALGSSSKFLGVPGETGTDGYWLNGVYNCAVCDGALFRDKVVAVVGGGDGAIVEAHYLSKLAKKVYLIVRKDSFKTVEENRKREVLAKANVEVRYLTTVEEIKGDGEKMTHILLKHQNQVELLPMDGLFLAIGSKPNTDLFQGQLKLDQLGYVIANGEVQTSIPGVFAIGDIADPIYRQAISAAADGMKASYQVDKFLASHPLTESTLFSNIANKETTASHPRVLDISYEGQFENALRESSLPIFIDFYASWCGPCSTIAPLFKSCAKALEGKVQFIKVNVDQFPKLSAQYKVGSLPTLVVIDRRGRMLDKRVGAKPISQLLQESSDRLEHSTPSEIDAFLRGAKR